MAVGRHTRASIAKQRAVLPRRSATHSSQESDVSGEQSKQPSSLDDKVAVDKTTSKKEMLRFAIPALGIYLSNPLMSNIDNAFVGQTVGTQGLAALSPATICTDQMLYLFSFLSRAATSLVSRGYGTNENTEAAREAGGPPLTVAMICGVALSIFYATSTNRLLDLLRVQPSLQNPAASYIYIRGAIAWAALAQSVALSMMMATRDALTPLKIIGLAAVVNVIGDSLLCVWPLRWGCTGASAATAFATLFSSGFMLKALKKKNLLPNLFKVPTKSQLNELMEFTGPLMAITVTRLIGFINMQRTAMRLGVQHLAAYQLSINLVIFFLLFGEPLSQLSQTKLPALLDSAGFRNKSILSADEELRISSQIKATLKSVLLLGAWISAGVGAVAGMTLFFGSGIFSSDKSVISLAKGASPSVFAAVGTAIFTVTVDGAMLASRDFGFMLLQGVMTMLIQLKMLSSPWCTSISHIYSTFTFRLGTYAMCALIRTMLGRGTLGQALRPSLGLQGTKKFQSEQQL